MNRKKTNNKKTSLLIVILLFNCLFAITFSSMGQCSSSLVNLKIRTIIHEKGSAISWVLRDNKTKALIKTSQPYPDNQDGAVFYDSVCVDPNATLIIAKNNVGWHGFNGNTNASVSFLVNNTPLFFPFLLDNDPFERKAFNVTANQIDGALIKVNIPDFVSNGDVIDARGIIFNVSSTAFGWPFDSLMLSYTIDNGPVNTKKGKPYDYSGVNSGYDYQCVGVPAAINSFTLGEHKMKMWISAVKSTSNSIADSNTLNDTLEKKFWVVGPNAQKTLIVHRTGEWCGWCGPGQTNFVNFLNGNPNTTIGVALHQGADVFSINDGANTVTGYRWMTYPGDSPDFSFFTTASVLYSANVDENVVNHMSSKRSPFTFNAAANYYLNTSTSDYILNMTSSFVSNTNITLQDNEQYRVNYWVVVDSLVDKQYDYGCNCWLNSYMHRYVLRQMINGVWAKNFISNNIVSSNNYIDNTFNKKLDFGLTYNPASPNFKIVGFIQKYDDIDVYDRRILSTERAVISLSGAGLKESQASSTTLVFPNPATNILYINNPENKPFDSFIIIDVLGRKVLEQKENANQINIQALEKGMYQLILTSDRNTSSSKFIKE